MMLINTTILSYGLVLLVSWNLVYFRKRVETPFFYDKHSVPFFMISSLHTATLYFCLPCQGLFSWLYMFLWYHGLKGLWFTLVFLFSWLPVLLLSYSCGLLVSWSCSCDLTCVVLWSCSCYFGQTRETHFVC